MVEFVGNIWRLLSGWLRNWRLSLFEKVILVNSIMLICEALAGLWITNHHLEVHHYLIDTSFIVVATLFSLSINIFLLRASFRPLFNLLTTIRAVSAGKTHARAKMTTSDEEIGELARAFNSMLDRLEKAQREQTKLILQAQEEERRRIALELHDEAGQNLTALLIHTEVLAQNVQELAPSAFDRETQQHLMADLQQLTQLAQHTLENIRVMAQQLRPSVLDDLGLLAAFRWLVEDSQQRLHLTVTLTIQDDPCWQQLPANYETSLFRIAQESLTNIARHAQATQATITLQAQPKYLSLTIYDNGRGYVEISPSTGSGIPGMRERARMLRGLLSVTSQPGEGTTVQARLPLPKKSPSPELQEIPVPPVPVRSVVESHV